MLLGDGTRPAMTLTGDDAVLAPYHPTHSDYAIEARIQIVGSPSSCYFGIRARVETVRSQYQGYFVGYHSGMGNALIATFGPNEGFTVVKSEQFSPGTASHLYRAEFRDNHVSLLIDGAPVVDILDNKFVSAGLVGLTDGYCQVQVSSFQLMGL